MLQRLRNRLKGRKGQSLVETAIALPIILLLFCGIVDFGWIMANTLIVENGSREGARRGAVVAARPDCVTQVRDRVIAITPGYSHPGMSVTTTLTNPTEPAKGDVRVTVRYEFPLLTPIVQIILGRQDYTATSTCVMKAE